MSFSQCENQAVSGHVELAPRFNDYDGDFNSISAEKSATSKSNMTWKRREKFQTEFSHEFSTSKRPIEDRCQVTDGAKSEDGINDRLCV